MSKYMNHHYVYTTGSIFGYKERDPENNVSTVFYYLRVVVNGKIFYIGEDMSLTDQAHATVFEEEAKKLPIKLRDRYSNVSVFSTTRKFPQQCNAF